ncbi:hypothetical protein [uncultured Algimonas sp.]|uniref:hypothetical protein n=1 Tax=uncultured Algimonas sp. TaxID=1547920 RepID=UPI00262D046D|nr:hypothetical protein [uncultured Algimonas sp.]
MNILGHWSDRDRQDYGSRVQTFPHTLAASGLFSDDALATLLDRHPRHLIDVCTMMYDPEFPDRHCTVDPGQTTGSDLVEIAKSGAIWINIREAMNLDPAYSPLLDRCYSDLCERTGQKVRQYNRRGGILISSPAAKVPYHCDPTQTLLWHVRGHKRVFVYPRTEAFLPDEAYEAIVLGERDQDVPYRPEYDQAAQVFDLPDDTLVCWPHTSPHRVENQGYCISMVMECTTRESAVRNGAMYFNGLVRRHLGGSPSWAGAGRASRYTRAICGHALRKLGAHRAHIRDDFVRFRLDPGKPSILAPVPAYIRNF